MPGFLPISNLYYLASDRQDAACSENAGHISARVQRGLLTLVADLVLVWQNALQPYAADLCAPLRHADASVRRHGARLVRELLLAHRVLPGGFGPALCRLWQDPDPEVRGRCTQASQLRSSCAPVA